MGGGEDDDDGAMAHFRTDYKILPTSNLSKEAWKPFQRGLETFPKRLGHLFKEAWKSFQRGLETFPKRLGSKGFWTISSRKIRCPKVFGKLGNLPREVYQKGLEIFSRGRCRTIPMIAGSLRSDVVFILKDDEGLGLRA